jgi:hypothetical protein
VGTQHAQHFVKCFASVGCFREVMDDPVRQHRIETGIWVGELASIAGVDRGSPPSAPFLSGSATGRSAAQGVWRFARDAMRAMHLPGRAGSAPARWLPNSCRVESDDSSDQCESCVLGFLGPLLGPGLECAFFQRQQMAGGGPRSQLRQVERTAASGGQAAGARTWIDRLS